MEDVRWENREHCVDVNWIEVAQEMVHFQTSVIMLYRTRQNFLII